MAAQRAYSNKARRRRTAPQTAATRNRLYVASGRESSLGARPGSSTPEVYAVDLPQRSHARHAGTSPAEMASRVAVLFSLPTYRSRVLDMSAMGGGMSLQIGFTDRQTQPPNDTFPNERQARCRGRDVWRRGPQPFKRRSVRWAARREPQSRHKSLLDMGHSPRRVQFPRNNGTRGRFDSAWGHLERRCESVAGPGTGCRTRASVSCGSLPLGRGDARSIRARSTYYNPNPHGGHGHEFW
ncbi:hypothetical protein LCGC14_0772320 [marine sediment metagenome]|uniref:Uncharacterized protein n=1 Tax=marine sediment metagenome TaxID=412755 RepID=A0A0F9QHQ8_9ZZZZ